MNQMKSYKLTELLNGLPVEVQGNADCVITGVAPLHQAEEGNISFLSNSQYRKYLSASAASAVIVTRADAVLCKNAAIICDNPYYIYAKVAGYFDQRPAVVPGIHPSAVVGSDCQIDPTASIGPHCTIGNGVTIGANTVLDAGVSIYHGVTIGKRCRFASGVVIGSDGFGFANQKGVWHKVPQLGAVEIGDDVDIGANTTIDRGAVGNTVIEDGVKLDNLIQVGHNVRIGAHTVIAGCVGIAGSTNIGKYCMIGGAANFAGHLSVADKVIITGMTAVTKSIREPGMYSSGIVGAVPNQEFLKNNARFHRLENLMERVKALEAVLKEKVERE